MRKTRGSQGMFMTGSRERNDLEFPCTRVIRRATVNKVHQRTAQRCMPIEHSKLLANRRAAGFVSLRWVRVVLLSRPSRMSQVGVGVFIYPFVICNGAPWPYLCSKTHNKHHCLPCASWPTLLLRYRQNEIMRTRETAQQGGLWCCSCQYCCTGKPLL